MKKVENTGFVVAVVLWVFRFHLLVILGFLLKQNTDTHGQ